MPKRRVRHVQDVRRLAAAALGKGGTITGPGVITWNVAGRCLTPRYIEVRGRAALSTTRDGVTLAGNLHENPLARMGHVTNWSDPPCTLEIWAKCRRCAPCLRVRSQEWTYRAKIEIAASARTWFGTMTLRPSEHWLASLRWQAAKAGRDWRELNSAEQFAAEHSVVCVEITRWLKRVRKESGARLRYLLVAEAHKSGLPHYHVLIHEASPLDQVGERVLRRQWKLGHSKFNLVEGNAAAGYVAKYLAKNAEARVRASIRYGQIGLSHSPLQGVSFPPLESSKEIERD